MHGCHCHAACNQTAIGSLLLASLPASAAQISQALLMV